MDKNSLSLLNTYSLTHLRSTLTNLIAPSIRLQERPLEKGSDLHKGSSRIGGQPDLPKGMRWPRYYGTAMSFLAQINLSDLASYDSHRVLPQHGLLSFFFDEEYDSLEPSSSHSHHKGWLIHYFPGDFSLLRHATPPASFSEEQRIPIQPLVFSPATTLPAWRSTLIESLHFSNDENEHYLQLLGQITHHYYDGIYQGVHQILGHPYAIQGDVFSEADNAIRHVANHKTDLADKAVVKESQQEWRLLLQIDMRGKEHPSLSGCLLYFLLPSAALAASDFSQSWLVIQCD